MTPQPQTLSRMDGIEKETGAQRIQRSQYIDVISTPLYKNKYFYVVTDEQVETPWIAIDKTGAEMRQEAFKTSGEMIDWLKAVESLPDAVTDLVDESDPMAVLQQAMNGNGNLFVGENAAHEITTGNLRSEISEPIVIPEGHAACVNPACEDFNEVMADWLFKDAICPTCGKPAKGASKVERETKAAPLTHSDPYEAPAAAVNVPVAEENPEVDAGEISIEQLRRNIEIEEEIYLPLYGRAAVLEAELKRRKQEFDKSNAILIADKNAAIAARDDQAKILKAFAQEYGIRTGEKQFDQYITFRENSVITWDEPTMIAWLEANFPAALIPSGVKVDEGRLKTYIRDCVKKDQELPPSVKIGKEWETLLSTKIPVPGLVGGEVTL